MRPKHLRDLARPKLDMLRICATQIWYIAKIAIQNGYVAILHERRSFMRLWATQRKYVATLLDPKKIFCVFARLDLGMLRSLRLKMGMLRHCATEILSDLARPKLGMLRLCATQIRYVAKIATQNGYVALCTTKETLRDFARPKTDIMRLCATDFFARHCTTQSLVAIIAANNENVAILCDQINCAKLYDNRYGAISLFEVCDFLFRPTRPKIGMFRPSRPRLNLFWPNRPYKLSMFRLCSTEEEPFNQFWRRTNHFDHVWPRKSDACCDACCDFALSKLATMRLCATQYIYVATLCDPN